MIDHAQNQNAFLILGHPGHELLVHHWLELARPRVFVLTDGSGGAGQSRIAMTRDCVEAAGAQAGGVFGLMSDRDWYRALLEQDHEPLTRAATVIAAEARQRRPALIVSDAVDGYNPMHDIACALAGAVCEALARDGAPPPGRLVFTVVGEDGPLRTDGLELELDEAAVERKIAAARAYWPLRDEVDEFLQSAPAKVATERFHQSTEPPAGWRPAYEEIGQIRVASGRYEKTIGYAQHVRPAVAAMRAAVSPGPV